MRLIHLVLTVLYSEPVNDFYEYFRMDWFDLSKNENNFCDRHGSISYDQCGGEAPGIRKVSNRDLSLASIQDQESHERRQFRPQA